MNNKGSALVLIVIVVLVVLAAVGGYIFLNRQGSLPNVPGQTVENTKDSEASLEAELNSVSLTEDNSDFTAVDKDINAL
jgi:flagellar basal body-associated protein FliL